MKQSQRRDHPQRDQRGTHKAHRLRHPPREDRVCLSHPHVEGHGCAVVHEIPKSLRSDMQKQGVNRVGVASVQMRVEAHHLISRNAWLAIGK